MSKEKFAEPIPEAVIDLKEVAEKQVIGRYLEHLHQINLNLTPQQWARLVPEIHTRDLSKDTVGKSVGEKYGITPLAMVSGSSKGEIIIDTRVEEMSEAQQHYILSHELGHKLDHYLSFARKEEMAELRDRLAHISREEISYYVGHLETSLKEEEGKPTLLEKEAVAEVIAQYLSGDRTFPAYIHQKLLQFPGEQEGDAENPEWAPYVEYAEANKDKLISVDEYLSHLDDETERQQMMENHPKLRAHWETWDKLNEIFGDEEVFEKLENWHWSGVEASADNQPEIGPGGEMVDDDNLVAFLHEPEPASEAEISLTVSRRPKLEPKHKQPTRQGFWDLVNFTRRFL